MINYIGNCAPLINWDLVVKDLESQKPAYIGPKHKAGDPIPELKEVTDLWQQAGYKTKQDGGTVSWDMFFPGDNFDPRIADRFAEFVKVEKYTTAWISRIWPGYFAPQHWDVMDDESNKPDVKRYHCHIGQPSFGHVFIVGHQCLYNQPQGATFEWSSRKLWHAGTNCGLTPKYILNFW